MSTTWRISNIDWQLHQIIANAASTWSIALALSFASAQPAVALEVFSAGMEVPQTISPIPTGFGSLGAGHLVPDSTFNGLTTADEHSKIWYVPESGGPPTLFAETKLGLRGGAFLPSGFGPWGGMFLTAGENDGELRDFLARRQADPNDPAIYPFEHVSQIVAYDADANAIVIAEHKRVFQSAAVIDAPKAMPAAWSTPMIAPDWFGEHGGQVFYTAQSGLPNFYEAGGVYVLDQSGAISQFASGSDMAAVGSSSQAVGAFGIAFAPLGFGEVAGKLLISNGHRAASMYRIFSITASGDVELFAEFPKSLDQLAAESGLRQMAFAPESFGAFGGMLFVSVSGSFFGGSALGQLLAIDETGQIAAHLKVGTEFDKFDPRGLYFTDDGRLLISDASDPILVATPADFVAVPEPATGVLFAFAVLVLRLRNSQRTPRGGTATLD